MTVPSEQQSVKYVGSGESGEGFPIPFSFRHSDVLKVATIDSDGVATQKVKDSHYKLYQRNSTGLTDPSDNSVRTEYGWIAWIGASPTTETILIYREETFEQDYDYRSGVAIPADQFEKSKDRLVDSMTTQLARDNADPSAFSAGGRKISTLGASVRSNDILTKDILDKMQTTASLTIPASGGAGDNKKLLGPNGLAPSTPTVSWQTKIPVPAIPSSESVLSPRGGTDWQTDPYVEWTSPRWITNPPTDNGLRYVYSYGTGDAVEGTNSSKAAKWREFREMLTLPQSIAGQDTAIVRLKSTTWQPPNNPASSTASYDYQLVPESVGRTDDATIRRMIAADGGAIVNAPRFDSLYHDQSVAFDGTGGSTFGDGDGTMARSSAFTVCKHPSVNFTATNTIKDDSDDLQMPQLMFLQVQPTGVTVGGQTAYPVFQPRVDMIDNRVDGTDNEFVVDVGNNEIDGSLIMMNMNQWLIGQTTSDQSTYLHWAGNITIRVHIICAYDSASGI